MFDKDMQIRGKYATYWKALTQLPGNAVETSKNFKIFENYIYVYMVAPIIGLLNGRKGQYDPTDDSKDTAGMLAEIQIKNASKLKYIYRLIVLVDDSLGLTDEEKINMAFREDNNEESVKMVWSCTRHISLVVWRSCTRLLFLSALPRTTIFVKCSTL